MAYRRTFEDDDDEIQMIIRLQRRPRVFKQRVNYMEVYNDLDFIDRFRLSKATFTTVLGMIEEITPRSQRNNAIPSASKLYMALRYLATGSFLLSAADFVGVSTSSACRYIHQVSRAIASLRPRFISIPTTDDGRRGVAQGFYERSRFPRVLGAVDCTHVKIQSPGGDDAETFRNRKQYFSINVQCICDARLKIMDIVARWPGSSHDQTIFDNSAAKFKFESGVIRGYYLLGDGGYEVTPYLMTPILNPVTRAQQLYNESHIRTRNVIERYFGVVKKRFPVLSKGITVHIDNTQALIVACAVLHNICINMGDDLPNARNENMSVGNDDDYHDSDSENDEPYSPSLRGRQERERLIRDHFANLE